MLHLAQDNSQGDGGRGGSDPSAHSFLGEGGGRFGLKASADSASVKISDASASEGGGRGRHVGVFNLGLKGEGKNVTPIDKLYRI